MLKGKNIILGITGGIAAYKSVYLLRLLIKAGCNVQVVITPNGKQFITPVTLSSLSGRPVISEFFSANTGEWHSHVDLGLWADAMVVAPATASSIAKMANGVADNMLITTYLSAKCPVFIAPAMDLDMMAHPSTCANIAKLKSYGNVIIEAADGELASHLCGKGRMQEPEAIVHEIEKFFARKATMAGQHILVTAGPTHEYIDPVRYIGNCSSGKMGYAIAEEAARRGAKVTLVSGPVAIEAKHPGITTVKVTSARQMYNACHAVFNDCDCAIMAAAVADYTVDNVSDTKIKREENGIESIRLVKNPDIAASLGNLKRAGQKLIGFALETDNEVENAKHKIERKNLDAIVLNSLKDKGAGFATDTNKISIIERNGDIHGYDLKSKADVASDILDFIANL